MESHQWFEILKESLTQTELELEAPQIEQMLLIHIQDQVISFPETSENKDFLPSSLLGQAWFFLSRILTNELQIETWNSSRAL